MDLTGYILAFDLDGTLVDTAPDIIGALNVVLHDEGITPYHLDEARPLIGRGALELMRRGFALAGSPLTAEREKPLLDRMLKYYEENIDVYSRPFDGLIEALDALSAMGARFAICTNKHTYLSVALIKRLGWTERFGSNRGADSVPTKKPAGGHLRACIDEMGGDMQKVVMIGDSETDFLTARNAGVPSILVSFGYSDKPIQDLACDVLIDHYSELVAAVAKVTNQSIK